MERFELGIIQHLFILQEKQKSRAANDLLRSQNRIKIRTLNLVQCGIVHKNAHFFPSHHEAYFFIPYIFTSLLSCFGQCYIIKYDANRCLASISALGLAVLLLLEPRECWNNLYNNKRHASQLSLSPWPTTYQTPHILVNIFYVIQTRVSFPSTPS